MNTKGKIFSSIAILGSAVFAMVLSAGTGLFETLGLFVRNRATIDSYGIELSNSKNDYNGSGSQSVLTELGNPINFSFFGCSTAPDAFANVSSVGYFGNTQQVTSIESIYPVFTADDGVSLEFRASFDKSVWGEYATLTSEKTFSLASHPYYLQFRANGGAVKVESINIKFTCVANPDAESGGTLEPTAFSPEIKETSDYSGTYLVGCDPTDSGSKTKIFDSSLETLDAEGNLINNVAVNNDGTINYSADLASKAITLSKIVKKGTGDVYSVKTSSGLYIGRSTYANGLETSTEPIENTVELNDGVLEIYGTGGCILAFNNNSNGGNRFRYMKSITEYNLQVTCYKLNSESSGTSGKPNYEAGILHTDTKSYKVTDKFADYVDNTGLNVSILMSDNTRKVINKSQYKYSVTFNGEEISPSNTFPHAGIYVVTITYGQLCPVKYEISVANVTNSIVAYKDTTSYQINASINLSDLSVIKWYYVDGTSNEIDYADFAANDLAVQVKNPSGSVYSGSTYNVSGQWTIHTYLVSNPSISYDLTINVATIEVTNITLDNSTLNLYIGDTSTLTPTITPDNATDKTVTWTTTNSTIASVNNGIVTANGEGTATITAKAGNKTATCLVTVSPVAVTGVTLSDSTKSMCVGEEYKLNATIAPTNATNKSVTWSVTSGDAVTVSIDGTVTAVKAGSATVQVKTNDGNKTATCTITVSNVAVSSIILNTNSLALYENGDKGHIVATVLPTNATDKTVTWTIDNSSVATISANGSSCEVTPVGSGTATVTATAGNQSATCSVTISDSVPTWTLVESESDLVAGNKYVIASNTKGVTAGDISSSIMGTVDSTFSSDLSVINSLGADTVQLTLGGSEDNWTFANNSNQLLGATAVKKMAWNSGTTTWEISINDGNATIYSTSSSYGRILHNTGSPRFTTYTSATASEMLLPQLYVLKYAGGSDDVLVESISVSSSSTSLDIGQTATLSATVLPANATNNAVSWSSDDSDVATVSASGIVTAVAPGTCTITATAKDGSGVTGTISITVKAPEVKLSSIYISNEITEYNVGETFIKPTVTAVYSDGSTANVTSSATFSGFNSSSAGQRTVTVSYTEDSITKSTSYVVTIKSSGSDIPDGDEYQITFRANGSDYSTNLNSSTIGSEITSGSSYILSYNSMDKVYAGKEGLKMASGSSSGYLDFNFASSISDNEATSIKLDVAQYGSDVGNVNVYINNESEPVLSLNSSTQTSETVTISSGTLLDRMKIISTKRSYLKGITISTKPVEPVNPTSISLNPSTLTMTKGETSKLSVSYNPSNTNQNKNITWTSSNTTVATVGTDGTVTAKANGSATITATGYQGITATCSVTVKDIAVTGISVSPTTAEVSIGSTKQLNATITPYNATNQGITWSSSNTGLATVDSNGLVTTKAAGTVTITATAQGDTTKKATSVITITEQALDKWTVLMYVCGADLESESGLASGDFDEICSVTGQPDDVNIVIQTGGAKSWDSTYGINASNNQRWHVEDNDLVCDNSKVYNKYTSMGQSSTLADFIGWGMQEYPAEKTALILWNHGGGMRGVCYDEKSGDDDLTNNELRSGISSGLSKAGADKLEWVGFDACLMAVQDIAEFLSPYANYMIASEESEAGYGWDYDNWVDDLYAKKETSVILKAICDSFIQDNGGTKSRNNDQTLSFMNLAYASAYKDAWEAMAAQCASAASSKGYNANNVISRVGSNVKHYAESDYNYFHLFDAYDFVEKIATTYLGVSSSYTDAVKAFYNTTYSSGYVNSSVNLNKFVCYSTCGAGAGASHGLCCVYVYTQDRDYSLINTYYTTSMTNFTTWRTFCRNYGDLD